MMREQQHQLEKRLLEMEGEAATYRQRAEEYGQNLKWLTVSSLAVLDIRCLIPGSIFRIPCCCC